jgi:hypothetical protein
VTNKIFSPLELSELANTALSDIDPGFISKTFFWRSLTFESKKSAGALYEVVPFHTKIKHIVSPSLSALNRTASKYSVDEWTAATIDILGLQFEQVLKRQEKLAVDNLVNGETYYPGIYFCVTRSRDLKVSCSWVGDADPLSDLRAWSAEIKRHSGFQATEVIFSPSAWGLFNRCNTIANMIAAFEQKDSKPVESSFKDLLKVGTLDGFEMYVYNPLYSDGDKVCAMMPDNTVILGNAEAASGSICIGRDCSGVAPMHHEMFVEDSTGEVFLQTTADVLPMLGLYNATLCATVA